MRCRGGDIDQLADTCNVAFEGLERQVKVDVPSVVDDVRQRADDL